MNDKSEKLFNIRNIFISIIFLWTGALIVYLGRYPNQLTALIFDQWKIILPFVSLMILAFGICQKLKWRAVRISLTIVCILFSLAILNFSVWMSILVQNNTPISLTGVMTDLSNDHIRVVSIPPDRSKLVELVESYSSEAFGEHKWHLLVYDKSGKIYFQQIINGKEIKRGHTIQINPPIQIENNYGSL